MHNLVAPDAETLDAIKAIALLKAVQIGAIREFEFVEFATANVDTVLNRLFQRCSVIRLRIGSRLFEIHEGGSIN